MLALVLQSRAVTIASSQPITLAVALFEDIVSRGLQALIDEDPNLRLVASDVEPDQLPSTLSDHRPDVVILNFGSAQVEITHRKFDECAITWDQIDMGIPIDWYEHFDWRPDPHAALRNARGRRLRAAPEGSSGPLLETHADEGIGCAPYVATRVAWRWWASLTTSSRASSKRWRRCAPSPRCAR